MYLLSTLTSTKAEAACGARALRTALGALKAVQGRLAAHSQGGPACLVCGLGTECGTAKASPPAAQGGGVPWAGVTLHARSPLTSRAAAAPYGHGQGPALVTPPGRAQSAGVSLVRPRGTLRELG